MHNNSFLVQLLVWSLRFTTTAICSRMIWMKNMCLSAAGTLMSHCEPEVLVAVDDGLLFVSIKQH